MDDLYLKGIVSVAALYAAANPWFRHHNTSAPQDLFTALLIFVFLIFAIGDLTIQSALWVCFGLICFDLAVHLLLMVKNRRPYIVFGAGKRHYEQVHRLVFELADQSGIPASAVTHTAKTPWLLVFKNVLPKKTAQFNKAFDKALRPLLGLEFWRLYPATIAALAFLAAVWRYM